MNKDSDSDDNSNKKEINVEILKEQEMNVDDENYSSSTDIYADDVAQNDDTTIMLDPNTDFFDDEMNNDKKIYRKSNDNDDDKVITTRKNRHLITDNDDEKSTQKDDKNVKSDVDDAEDNVDQTEKYMNDEEEGGSGYMSRDETGRNHGKTYSRYKTSSYRNKFKLDFNGSKSQKSEGGQKDVRYFDDDDEDDDDDDENDDDDEEKGKDDDRNLEGSGGNFNDDNSRNNDDEDDNAFFALKRKSNKYFRKNTNDAIKIISTPHGKVGIVYQQTPDTGKSVNVKDKSGQLEQTDSLSSSSSQNRDKFLNQKITPVLTADGKVALLYRGDSENTKYEPILNLTHTFNVIGKDNYDNKTSAVNNNAKVYDNDNDNNDGSDGKIVVNMNGNDDHQKHHHHHHPHQSLHHHHHHHHHNYHDHSVSNNDSSRSSSVSNSSINSDNDRSTIKEDNNDLRPKFFEPDDSYNQEQKQQYSSVSTSLSLNPIRGNDGGSENENPILPNINRPLSEVLGIKKNQFRQFRIKDTPTEPTQKTIQTTPNNYVNYAQYTTTNFRQQQIPAVRSSTNFDDFDTREFDDRISKYNRLDNGILRSESTNQQQNQQHQHQQQQQQHSVDESLSSSSSITSSSSSTDILAKTEVINLAIIPHFDEEFERQQRYHEQETNNNNHRHYKQRHRYRHLNEDLSGVHCAMQAMMGVAAISTVFGMLGAFFKQRILDQIRMMHW